MKTRSKRRDNEQRCQQVTIQTYADQENFCNDVVRSLILRGNSSFSWPGIGMNDVAEAWVKKLYVIAIVITANSVMLTKYEVSEAV